MESPAEIHWLKGRLLALAPLGNPTTIKLAYSSGKYEVPAIIIAKNWAIHRIPLPFDKKPTKFSNRWGVTHIPTGRSAWWDIKHQAVAEHAARFAARVAPDTRGMNDTGDALRVAHFRDVTYQVGQMKRASVKAAIARMDELEKEFKDWDKKQKKRWGSATRKATKRATALAGKKQRPKKRETKKKPKRRSIDLIALARKARREREQNPRGPQLSLFEENPSYAIKSGRFPQLIVGQVGRQAVYRYGDWEIVIGPAGKDYWRAVMKPDDPNMTELVYGSTTFDGAVCAAKIGVDMRERLHTLDETERDHFHRMFEHLFHIAHRQLISSRNRKDPPPDRASVARDLEEIRRAVARGLIAPELRPVYVWFNGLDLDDRLGLIDDELRLLYCTQGTDPKRWA